MADTTTSEEARLYLQQIKEQGLDERARQKALNDYLDRLTQERQSYYEEQLKAQTDVATGYQGIYKAGINAKAGIAKALIQARTSRDNTILSQRAADLRSLRSALAHASGAKDARAISIVERAVQGQSQARSATGEANSAEVIQGAANQLAVGIIPANENGAAVVRVFEQTYGDPRKYLRGDALTRWNQLAKQGESSEEAVGAILSAPSIDAVINGTADPGQHAEAQKVLDDYLDKVQLDESDFNAPTGETLKNDPIVKEYDSEIARVKDDLALATDDGMLTDEERARLIADPAFREFARDFGFDIGNAKVKLDEQGNPVKDARGNVLGDTGSYEPGKDDDAAIAYAAAHVQGKAEFRPSLGEIVSIRVMGEPGEAQKRLAWSDGKYRTAVDPKTGRMSYLPPEMEKAAQEIPLQAIWRGSKDGFPTMGYVKKGEDIYWTDYLGKQAIKLDMSDPEIKRNYERDVHAAEGGDRWSPIYVQGSDGKAVQATDVNSLVAADNVTLDPTEYGGMSTDKPVNKSGLPAMSVTDKPPAPVHDIYVQRLPRNLRTDRKGTLRAATGRGDAIYDWDEQSQAYRERIEDKSPVEGARLKVITGPTTQDGDPRERAVKELEEPPEMRSGRMSLMPDDSERTREMEALKYTIDSDQATPTEKRIAQKAMEKLVMGTQDSDAQALERVARTSEGTGATKAAGEARLAKSFAENRAEDQADIDAKVYTAFNDSMADALDPARITTARYLAARRSAEPARDMTMRYAAETAKDVGLKKEDAIREVAEAGAEFDANPTDRTVRAVKNAQGNPVIPPPDLNAPPSVAIQPGSAAAVARAKELAGAWASTSEDTRTVPAAVKDIATSTGVDKARIRAILKKAEQKATTPTNPTPVKSPTSYVEETN